MAHPRFVRTAVTSVGAVLLLLASQLANTAAAQERPRLAVDVSAGWVGFADDGIVNERVLGGAARVYLLPRVSVGPEVLYIGGQNHSHLVATGNLTWDLSGGGPGQVTPFVVVGGGLFRTRESFFTGTFTSNEGAFTAGGGVRASVGDRVDVGIDARLGWEAHLRVNGFVGVRLWR
jgi:hypothetical protein